MDHFKSARSLLVCSLGKRKENVIYKISTILDQMKFNAFILQGAVSVAAASFNEIDNFVLDPHYEFQSEPSLQQLWGEDQAFSGVHTFAHLPYSKCLVDPEVGYDIALFGVPFDTATSYRPGARFGPAALRSASQRQGISHSYNYRAGINPYTSWAKVVDCGDIPVTPMDNNLALKQMTKGYGTLLDHNTSSTRLSAPKLVMLGGDHSITLPALRNLYQKHGKISLIHFDAHLDTWIPERRRTVWHSDQSEFTHGSMLWMAHEEGLISDNSNMHVGLRTRVKGIEDFEDDDNQGFARIFADDVHELGLKGIVDKILKRVPEGVPVYISVDIDCLDPSAASGTGTPEAGGLLSRELIYIIRRLENLNIVGADLVEVAPAYDSNEVTALAGAQILYEIITSMVKKDLKFEEPKNAVEIFEHIGDRIVNQIQGYAP